MTMDETLYGVAEKVQNFAVIYLVDITAVPDFNKVCMLIEPVQLSELTRIWAPDVRVVRPLHCDVLLSVSPRFTGYEVPF